MPSAPSLFDGLAALQGFGDTSRCHRRASRASAPWLMPQSSRLYLGSTLPINLRRFLALEFGSSMRVENDAIVALKPQPGDTLMRELARAIRRFSAERSRQAWSECAISLGRLESEFFRAPAGERCPVVLCLRCACVGAGPLDEHGGINCLPVNLDSAPGGLALPENSGTPSALADALLQAIENFRMAREAVSMPHYDLDCFVAGGQVIFTWRPLAALTRL
jgi:hypothetical protein